MTAFALLLAGQQKPKTRAISQVLVNKPEPRVRFDFIGHRVE
jgi:hypothetical protein